ncbi:MAG TPA: hypothetical protein PKC67_14700 [Kiritimatiellia bacterium]|nr:hypothetical protein [Kiritimatiellia bacterium]HMP35583.1 hypothetical protein [Kiritimatiellia bacterium]
MVTVDKLPPSNSVGGVVADLAKWVGGKIIDNIDSIKDFINDVISNE